MMFRGCSSDVSGMFQGRFGDVPRVFRGCVEDVSGMLRGGCFGDVSEMFRVSGMFLGCFGIVSGMFQGCSGDVSGMFRGCFVFRVWCMFRGCFVYDSVASTSKHKQAS